MKRLNKLINVLTEKGIDGFMITSVPNITYLTGFSGDASRLIISRGRVVLITDGRYSEQARKECFPEIEVVQWLQNKRYGTETYREMIRISGIQSLGFESQHTTYSEYQDGLRFSIKLARPSAASALSMAPANIGAIGFKVEFQPRNQFNLCYTWFNKRNG